MTVPRQFLLVCLPALLLWAGQQTLIRTSVQVVEVSVVATGAKAPLDARDFRLWDNGQEQTILSLQKVDSQAASGTTELPPNTFSNRIGKAGQAQVLSMILLDAANTKYRYQGVGRHAVETTLQQLAAGERVALYAFGSELRTLHDFSADRQSLLEKLRAYRGERTVYDDALPEWRELRPIAPAVRLRKDWVNHDRVVDTLAALESLASHVKGIPGRKNLIWVTEGFPLFVAGERFLDEVKRAMAVLNDAGVSLYPVDLRGLMVAKPDPATDPMFVMQDLAAATGGRAYYNRNDLDRGMRLALEDSREVYWLTYSPSNILPDGAYHRIRMESKLKGIETRYRLGYYAPAKEAESAAGSADRMTSVMASPVDSTGIGIRAALEPSADRIALAVQIDPSDLNLVQNAGKWTGALHLEAMQTGAAGERLGGVSQAAELSLKQAVYDRALLQGLRFEMKFSREPAAVAVRIGVVDEKGGHAGSLLIPLLPR